MRSCRFIVECVVLFVVSGMGIGSMAILSKDTDILTNKSVCTQAWFVNSGFVVGYALVFIDNIFLILCRWIRGERSTDWYRIGLCKAILYFSFFGIYIWGIIMLATSPWDECEHLHNHNFQDKTYQDMEILLLVNVIAGSFLIMQAPLLCIVESVTQKDNNNT
mgnify:CR=1 FL=1